MPLTRRVDTVPHDRQGGGGDDLSAEVPARVGHRPLRENNGWGTWPFLLGLINRDVGPKCCTRSPGSQMGPFGGDVPPLLRSHPSSCLTVAQGWWGLCLQLIYSHLPG